MAKTKKAYSILVNGYSFVESFNDKIAIDATNTFIGTFDSNEKFAKYMEAWLVDTIPFNDYTRSVLYPTEKILLRKKTGKGIENFYSVEIHGERFYFSQV